MRPEYSNRNDNEVVSMIIARLSTCGKFSVPFRSHVTCKTVRLHINVTCKTVRLHINVTCKTVRLHINVAHDEWITKQSNLCEKSLHAQ
jgi:hypothetical protein